MKLTKAALKCANEAIEHSGIFDNEFAEKGDVSDESGDASDHPSEVEEDFEADGENDDEED